MSLNVNGFNKIWRNKVVDRLIDVINCDKFLDNRLKGLIFLHTPYRNGLAVHPYPPNAGIVSMPMHMESSSPSGKPLILMLLSRNAVSKFDRSIKGLKGH